jgi:hypothetical protein
MSYDNLSSVSQNVLKFYQQLTGEERRIPFIFDDFHFCRSRVIGLDMTENRIFMLCQMITWVVFLRMFWNFISSLPVKRGGSLSFLVRTISNVLVMEIGWTDVGHNLLFDSVVDRYFNNFMYQDMFLYRYWYFFETRTSVILKSWVSNGCTCSMVPVWDIRDTDGVEGYQVYIVGYQFKILGIQME